MFTLRLLIDNLVVICEMKKSLSEKVNLYYHWALISFKVNDNQLPITH